MPIPVILDVDTGVDDALALLFAAAHPELDLIGVSCVAGNAPLLQVVENTLRVLALAGATDVPVAAGAHRPLIESPRDASHVHGADGLAGVELPPAVRTAESDGAVAFLRRRILASPEPVTLVALAPQTNLALLLRTHPEVTANIGRIVFMGGSASVGNATALAEFNVWHDPEAASIVLGSGVPLFMYGLDVFNHVSVARRRPRRSRHPTTCCRRWWGACWITASRHPMARAATTSGGSVTRGLCAASSTRMRSRLRGCRCVSSWPATGAGRPSSTGASTRERTRRTDSRPSGRRWMWRSAWTRSEWRGCSSTRCCPGAEARLAPGRGARSCQT
ncbi:nucleoside hydrolase [Homoserinibacter gongjuensis]|uniref:Inosine/uridine-preferring nucleoside hydrolase domain-containing protein n=1 Tax=Homoserinibacter gongjuensis TaxID=1162968 RepID=A0ABQ6JVU5_9MICO|nr:nucleoside hydrolase [Homoserinibacter gongjuensis]GMA91488.1 hypothetical protein GCM10025869_20170 [Homoserinibacter gongjuensis]